MGTTSRKPVMKRFPNKIEYFDRASHFTSYWNLPRHTGLILFTSYTKFRKSRSKNIRFCLWGYNYEVNSCSLSDIESHVCSLWTYILSKPFTTTHYWCLKATFRSKTRTHHETAQNTPLQVVHAEVINCFEKVHHNKLSILTRRPISALVGNRIRLLTIAWSFLRAQVLFCHNRASYISLDVARSW